jgi:hypothetical protein
MKLNWKWIKRGLLALAFLLVATGYANIEGITWGFRWEPYWHTVDFFDLGAGLKPSQWVAFEIFSVLPFGVGCFLFGCLVRDLR